MIGGDGSFHEVVNGYLARTDGQQIALGLLPGGSGNSVSYDFKCNHVVDAAQKIADGQFCWMDANRIQFDQLDTCIYSINLIGLGLLGDIGVLAEDFRWLGVNRYNIVAIWIMLKRVSKMYKTSLDGEKSEGNFITIAANHTQHAGKGVRFFPRAKVDDEKMDVLLLPAINRGEILRLFLQVTSGRLDPNEKKLIQKQVKELIIETEKPGTKKKIFFPILAEILIYQN